MPGSAGDSLDDRDERVTGIQLLLLRTAPLARGPAIFGGHAAQVCMERAIETSTFADAEDLPRRARPVRLTGAG